MNDYSENPCLDVAEHWEAIPLIDGLQLRQWTIDLDRADVLAIISAMPADARSNVEQFENAACAGDLASAKRIAHRLKGMALNLGARRLGELARSAEHAAQAGREVTEFLSPLRRALEATLDSFAALAKPEAEIETLGNHLF